MISLFIFLFCLCYNQRQTVFINCSTAGWLSLSRRDSIRACSVSFSHSLKSLLSFRSKLKVCTVKNYLRSVSWYILSGSGKSSDEFKEDNSWSLLMFWIGDFLEFRSCYIFLLFINCIFQLILLTWFRFSWFRFWKFGLLLVNMFSWKHWLVDWIFLILFLSFLSFFWFFLSCSISNSLWFLIILIDAESLTKSVLSDFD